MIDPKDIVTVSELQDRLAPTLSHVRKTGRPVVVTQRGKPAGVLLGIEDYTRLAELARRGPSGRAFAHGVPSGPAPI